MVVAVVAVVLTPPASSSTHSGPGSHATRWLELASAPGPTLSGRPVVVTVDPAATIAPVVPADFLGLSFEAGNLPSIAGYADSGDLVNLLRSLGQGIMRFGGGSSDKTTAWLQEGATPPWAQTTIVPQDLAGLAGLARATGWRVLLTVNFGHYEPVAAAQEAGAAQAALGASLAGIAIGNEPDRYVKDKLRASPWPFADYLTEAGAYRAAIAAAAPGVPIVGPDSSSGGSLVPWVTDLATAVHPALLTDHYYPLTKCQRYRPKPSDLESGDALARDGEAEAGCGRLARERDPAAARRDQQRLVSWAAGREQRVRLGAVGGGLHRARDGERRERNEPPRPDRRTARLQPARSRGRAGARERRAARQSGVVRAAARLPAGR